MSPSQEDLALLDVDAVLDRAAATLAAKYAGVFNTETVERCVRESYVALFRTASIRTHLPALAEHFAGDRLRALAQAGGAIDKAVPEVLFLCVENAGRSQMAAALLEHHAGGRVHVRSAGSHPTADVEGPVVQVMHEIGLDLAEAYPKPLTDDVLRAADVIITMGCGDACPILPGKRYFDWQIDDPAHQAVEVVRGIRGIRDSIDTRVQSLLAEILPAPTGAASS
ncbi:arsenate reductase ArsC [Actinopolymorpha alba]|uniref:arsenate reductase ArsC n=1 Tax=Actinopolymorpha alba TaxID=533267 RepID=UPI00036F8F57|nr:arsenate reductase ArsC [Actinopolymorpha alba]